MLLILLVIVAIPALIAGAWVSEARLRAALLAGWGSLTLLGFAPAGLLFAAGTISGSGSSGGGLVFVATKIVISFLAVFVSLQGFVAGVALLRRVVRLARGEAEDSGKFLLFHHVAVLVTFAMLDLVSEMGGGLSLFCLIACGAGALLSIPIPVKAPLIRPVAF